ncbi:MAG: hypothetical protein QMD61_06900 [Methanobacterium sp.]|nr:hypothetical protein [Methanobacterium sp.]
MKLKTVIIMTFLVIGLLGVPNCISAQEYQVSPSDAVLESSLAATHLNALTPAVKGGSRGGSSSGISKTVKKLSDGDDDDASGDGGSWWIAIIIIVIIIAIIAVWYLFLRK